MLMKACGVCAGPAMGPRAEEAELGQPKCAGAGWGTVPAGWPPPYLVPRLPSLTSGSISSSLSRRAVRVQLGLVPSVLFARWDWASLLFPSYHPALVSRHLPPTILWTLPQSPQAAQDGSGRGASLPDIISGVGSGWPSRLELGWGREAGSSTSGRQFQAQWVCRNGFLSCLWPAEFRKSLGEISSGPHPPTHPAPNVGPAIVKQEPSCGITSLSFGKSVGEGSCQLSSDLSFVPEPKVRWPGRGRRWGGVGRRQQLLVAP